MITAEQQKWLDHLSNTDIVSVVPWDNTAELKFEFVKKQLQLLLGNDQPIEHRGATSLGISGQDEIDVYLPVPPEKFRPTVDLLIPLLGQPRSCYELIRARFVLMVEGKHVDIFVVNQNHDDWKNGERFHQYLLSNPETLEEYRHLKESLSGHSVREYYQEKIKFINDIMEKVKND
ncbi:MAG TPA: GrpB family protein [bacterium]|nr:GrpB family protein [bacterium]